MSLRFYLFWCTLGHMDFTKQFNAATLLPEISQLPEGDVFAASKAAVTPPFITVNDDPAVIPGVVGYKLDYRCRRFFMGKELEAIDQNTKIFTDRDESAELRDTLDLCLKGRAIIQKRLDTILPDGSIVVWLEWAIPVARTAPDTSADPADARLPADKLLSPERVTPRSRAEDALEDREAPAAARPEDEEGESYEDEDPW